MKPPSGKINPTHWEKTRGSEKGEGGKKGGKGREIEGGRKEKNLTKKNWAVLPPPFPSASKLC